MFAFVLCLLVLLASATLAHPAERQANDPLTAIEQPLCSSVRAAANAPEQEELSMPLPDGGVLDEGMTDRQFSFRQEWLSPAERLKHLEDRTIFETSLTNWKFFEDLAPKQRAIIRGVVLRCGFTGARASLPASVFGQWNSSERATFVPVTHALLHTRIIDSRNGKELGNGLGLIEALLDVQGENHSLPSDRQFQLIVRLTPEARDRLEHDDDFLKGENHVFHKGYPISFRQFRKIWLPGQEAGLHFCLSKDGRFAQIHIDYRFGLLHLAPANSDVRAEGNHRRHADRWPQFAVEVKPMETKRAVL